MNFLSFVGPWQWVIIILALSFLLLPIIALIDILKSDFKGNNKLIWVIVVIFFSLIGVLLYYTIGKQQKIRKTET
jgi:Phospholipase_D-nuclease N-terminal